MNVGKNRGRRLQKALDQFTAMLIEEALDISGFSYARLDEALGLEYGQSKRYSVHPRRGKTRAPQAAAIQQLENRVAKLLARCAHTVVVENRQKIHLDDVHLTENVEGCPGDGLNLRQFDVSDFQLGYADDWPTYHRLKYPMYQAVRIDPGRKDVVHQLVEHGAHDKWPQLLQAYSWQWGVLWDRGLPWLTRERFGVSAGVPICEFLPAISERIGRERALIANLGKSPQGRQLLDAWELSMLSPLNGAVRDIVWERIAAVAAVTKRLVQTGRASWMQSEPVAVLVNDEPPDDYFNEFVCQ